MGVTFDSQGCGGAQGAVGKRMWLPFWWPQPGGEGERDGELGPWVSRWVLFLRGLLATFPGFLLYFVKLPGLGRRPVFPGFSGSRWLAFKVGGGQVGTISLLLQMASKKGKSNFPKWVFEMAAPLGRLV